MMQASNERDWPKTFNGIDEFFHKYYKAVVEDSFPGEVRETK